MSVWTSVENMAVAHGGGGGGGGLISGYLQVSEARCAHHPPPQIVLITYGGAAARSSCSMSLGYRLALIYCLFIGLIVWNIVISG